MEVLIEIKKLSYILEKQLYTFQKRSILTKEYWKMLVNDCPDYTDYTEPCDCRLVKIDIYHLLQKMQQPSSINYRGRGFFFIVLGANNTLTLHVTPHLSREFVSRHI